MINITSVALTGLFLWTGASTTPIAEWVVPQTTPETEASMLVRLTGYNAVPEQTDSDPTTTASGLRSNPETIAARSVDLAMELPFGTIIALESTGADHSCGFEIVDHLIGYRVIADSMHPRKTQQIDLMFDGADTVDIGVNGNPRKATNPAVALGVCSNVEIRIIGKLELAEIPSTQSELAKIAKKLNRSLAIR